MATEKSTKSPVGKPKGMNYLTALKFIRSGGEAYRKAWEENPGSVDHVTVHKNPKTGEEKMIGHDYKGNRWNIRMDVSDVMATDWIVKK